MWVCTKCGCTNEDSNKFCSDCGVAYEETAETVIEKVEETDGKEIASASDAGFVNVAAAAAMGEAKAAQEEEKERQERLMKEAAAEQEKEARKAEKRAEKERRRAEKQARKDAERAHKEGMAPPPPEGFGPGGHPDDIHERGKESNIAQKILGPLSIICGLIGIFSGGYAAIISFLNFQTSLLFFIPSAVAVLFGVICLVIGIKKQTRKIQILAIIGLILGLLGLVFWIVVMMMLRSRVITETGGTELMDVLRMLLNQ